MLTLVLLPGLDGTGIFFEDFADLLRKDATFKPLVISYPNDPALGYIELESFVRATLPRDERFILLGESFAGPLATMIAASNPPNLVALILCVTFARNPHPLLPLATAALKPLPAFRVPYFIQHRNIFGKFSSAPLRAKLRSIRGRVSAKTLKARLECVARVDVTEKLRTVKVPILDLRAIDDRVVSGASGDYIRKILPGVATADLDSPHVMLQAVPHEALAAIKKFVSERVS
jgi:pimeloyl-[acyl-carrier protein] methyl ester esterase